MTDDERRELKDQIMLADLRLKKAQWLWETPKGLAAVTAALAVTIGAIGGILGYQIGRNPTPPTQIIFQPGAIQVQPAPPTEKP